MSTNTQARAVVLRTRCIIPCNRAIRATIIPAPPGHRRRTTRVYQATPTARIFGSASFSRVTGLTPTIANFTKISSTYSVLCPWCWAKRLISLLRVRRDSNSAPRYVVWEKTTTCGALVQPRLKNLRSCKYFFDDALAYHSSPYDEHRATTLGRDTTRREARSIHVYFGAFVCHT